jgi:hypothetical protein
MQGMPACLFSTFMESSSSFVKRFMWDSMRLMMSWYSVTSGRNPSNPIMFRAVVASSDPCK